MKACKKTEGGETKTSFKNRQVDEKLMRGWVEKSEGKGK